VNGAALLVAFAVCSRTTADEAVDAGADASRPADGAAPDSSAYDDASDAAHDACAPGPCWTTAASGSCGVRTLWECPIVEADAGDPDAYPASLPSGCEPQSLNGLLVQCSGALWCCP